MELMLAGPKPMSNILPEYLTSIECSAINPINDSIIQSGTDYEVLVTNISMFIAGNKDIVNPDLILGTGSFGIVIKVRKDSDNTNMALKIEKFSPFNREKEIILKKLIEISENFHPNLSKIFSTNTDYTMDVQGMLQITLMEFISGGELFKRIVTDSKTFNVVPAHRLREASSLTKQICEGTKHLHANGIIHLDLKLENIMMHGEICKIIDYDLGIIIQEDGNNTSFKKSGSTNFIIPEMFMKDKTSIDTITNEQYYNRDTYSILCIFFAILLQSYLFTSELKLGANEFEQNIIVLQTRLGDMNHLPNTNYYEMLLADNLIQPGLLNWIQSLETYNNQIYKLILTILKEGTNADYVNRSKVFTILRFISLIDEITSALDTSSSSDAPVASSSSSAPGASSSRKENKRKRTGGANVIPVMPPIPLTRQKNIHEILDLTIEELDRKTLPEVDKMLQPLISQQARGRDKTKRKRKRKQRKKTKKTKKERKQRKQRKKTKKENKERKQRKKTNKIEIK